MWAFFIGSKLTRFGMDKRQLYQERTLYPDERWGEVVHVGIYAEGRN